MSDLAVVVGPLKSSQLILRHRKTVLYERMSRISALAEYIPMGILRKNYMNYK